MTPRALIEEGIRLGDLASIARGFAALTGVSVEPPAAANPDPLAAEALAWYADPLNYSLDDGGFIPIMLDEGRRAREACGRPAEGPPVPLVKAKAKPKPKPKPKPSCEAEPPRESRPPPAEARAFNDRNWVPPAGNLFVDDKRQARGDLKSTRWINENITPAERRPEHNDPLVEVACDECGNNFKCRRSEVRHKRAGSVDSGGDVGTENYCQRCLTGSGGAR